MSMHMYIVWSPQWEFGIPIIDEQHRGIVSLINTLFYFITQRRGEDVVLPLIKTVKDYWSLHCMTEEELMIESGFPGAEEHTKEHQRLAVKLFDLFSEIYISKDYAEVSDRLMEFFKKEQAIHINKSDMLYVKHIKKYLTARREI